MSIDKRMDELERVDAVWRVNTDIALRELFRLYHNGNYVSSRINERYTRIDGYTKHSDSELMAAIDQIRSRYGYYCDIVYKYDPCYMFLTVDVMMRR